MINLLTILLLWISAWDAGSGTADRKAVNLNAETLALSVEEKAIAWRRHLHQYPELSNREYKTAEFVARHLSGLGMQVQTGVAHTGVVGLLDSGRPGPVIALRADMDALPVTERVDLPFASTEKAEYNGMETGVMHACGHDAHTAILMAVAEALANNRQELVGKVKFIFQPAEEGAPEGEEGGAELMVREGVLTSPKPDMIFGLHMRSTQRVGTLSYKPQGFLAAADKFSIRIAGVQSHGSQPWRGVDPIAVSALVIQGLQHIVSRQIDLTQEPAVLSIGMVRGGIRNNILPEEVEMVGTIRTFDTAMQRTIHEKIRLTASRIAESAGARADVDIDVQYPVTYNDPALTARSAVVLQAEFGAERVMLSKPVTVSEDFSFYAREVPGFFFFVGACPADRDPALAPEHHTPDFYMDEGAIRHGIRAMLALTFDGMYESR
jgi:amidohydrolase